MAGFRYRGVIEGYYGPPWSHENRLWMIERMGAWGMNLYVYAPKSDPLHRERWREPYPETELQQFRELVERGEAGGVEVGFALSPGLSIRYSSSDDRATLARKLVRFRAMGVRFLSLAVDDVPTRLVHEEDRRAFRSLAEAHVTLSHDLRDRLGEGVTLWLVPTDYLGVEPTPYLEELGERLDPEVEVAWTGRTVVSPTIRADEAARRAKTLRRPLLLWDNIPASDGPMRPMLHLAPYAGREPGLAEHASGVLLNPMEHTRASGVAVRSAARFLLDPRGYDPEQAWEEALAEIGAGAPDAFRIFAEAHRFHASWPDDRDRELEAGLHSLRSQLERGDNVSDLLGELRRQVALRLGCAEELREGLSDAQLRQEIEPWIEAHACETRRIQAALDGLDRILSGPTSSDRCAGLLGLGFRLTLEPTPVAQSYGPRRVFYPQFTSMQEDEMAFGSDPALFRDSCLADAFVEFVEDIALERLTSQRR
jgi:hyaluronoglucosaminidase